MSKKKKQKNCEIYTNFVALRCAVVARITTLQIARSISDFDACNTLSSMRYRILCLEIFIHLNCDWIAKNVSQPCQSPGDFKHAEYMVDKS